MITSYHRVCNLINTTGATSGAGTAYPSCVHTQFLWGSCYSIVSFMCMFCRSLFVLFFFFFYPLCCLFFCLLSIVLSVLLRYTDSDYPFGIFKLFFIQLTMMKVALNIYIYLHCRPCHQLLTICCSKLILLRNMTSR